jgi:uncharacterized protein (DUF1697 family)
MDQWVALLRGVNVGGGNKVPMAALRDICVGLGWREVRTYIASGNVVFRADPGAHSAQLRAAMRGAFGVDVPVMVVTASDMRAALAACPFDPVEGKQVHAFFLWDEPVVDDAFYQALRLPDEMLTVTGRLVWLWAPGGVGRSKLAEKLGKVITGTDMTGRNLNTLRGLVEMLDA